RNIGVVFLVVAVNAFVIRKAAEYFIVARIREPHSVGAVHVVVVLSITIQLALLRDGVPEKWHERLPAEFGCVTPEPGVESTNIPDILLIIGQSRIRTCA